jgi:hypothetical protein
MRHDIFPTPLWHIEGAHQQLVDELYQGAYRFKENYKSSTISNEGGYQSPMFDWKEFHPQGIEYIDKVVGDIFPFKVESWWYNINGKGHWNLPHSHANCHLALILYLTDSDGLLSLMSPFPQRIVDRLGDHINVDAKKGDILIFPSDIVHFVRPNERETDRVCISMNLQLCEN